MAKIQKIIHPRIDSWLDYGTSQLLYTVLDNAGQISADSWNSWQATFQFASFFAVHVGTRRFDFLHNVVHQCGHVFGTAVRVV